MPRTSGDTAFISENTGEGMQERGKSHARQRQLLAEGDRYEKTGLVAKALQAYRAARAGVSDGEIRAESWRCEAFVHHARGAWDDALAAARESLAAAREIGRDDLLAEALNAEAAVHFSRGHLDQALPLYTRMLGLTDHPRIRGFALQNMGILYARRGEPDRAERRLEEAYLAFARADYAEGKAHVLNNHAAVSLDRGEYDHAERLARRAMAAAREVSELDLLAIATLNHAEALQELGRLEEAESAASIAFGQFEISGNRWRRVACLRILGDVHSRLGDTDTAHRFWRRGLELARELGAGLEAGQLMDRLPDGLDGDGS